MSETPSAGHLEYRYRTYRLDLAECVWTDGFLSFRCSGSGCGLGVACVPFIGVEWLGDLSGCRSKEIAGEAGCEFQGQMFTITAIDLICTGYSAKTGIVSLDLWCRVQDGESGEEGIVEAKMRCLVVERGTGRWWP
jgi:hypothetical protein